MSVFAQQPLNYRIVSCCLSFLAFISCKQQVANTKDGSLLNATNLPASCRIESVSELVQEKGISTVDYILNCNDGSERTARTQRNDRSFKPGDRLNCSVKNFGTNSVWNCADYALEFVSDVPYQQPVSTAMNASQSLNSTSVALGKSEAGIGIPAQTSTDATSTVTSSTITTNTVSSSSSSAFETGTEPRTENIVR